MMLTNTGIFLCGLKLSREKVDLSKYSWYPKRKLGVTMHFSEIIKFQFEKERHTLLCTLKLFTNIIHELAFKCVKGLAPSYLCYRFKTRACVHDRNNPSV